MTGAPPRRGGYPVLRKPRDGWEVAPNLIDYEATCAGWSWARAFRDLDGLPEGRGLNVAHEAVDRHAAGPRRWKAALRAVAADGTAREVTYGDLRAATSRFAAVLYHLGIEPGDRVFTLTGAVPETAVAALGSWKAGAVHAPLLPDLPADAAARRLARGRARVLVAPAAAYAAWVADHRRQLPALEHVILVGGGARRERGVLAYEGLVADAGDRWRIPATDPDQSAFLHFTGGVAGPLRGVVHTHAAVAAHHATGRFALDLRAGDVAWCTLAPGGMAATAYGLVAPLVVGATALLHDAPFDAARWLALLRQERVNVWCTAPHAVLRLMQAAGAEPVRFDLPRLRCAASVGEPLAPEAVLWGAAALGHPVHDAWCQTEAGAILVANTVAADVKPGSMGRPVPGVEAALLPPDRRAAEPLGEPEAEGELAFRRGWPSLFRRYLADDGSYEARFTGPWYRTGDLVRRDADGYLWYRGRLEDLMDLGGIWVGPFEIEAVLYEHPAVAEVAAVGGTDGSGGRHAVVFVVLRRGAEAGDAVVGDLLAHARTRLGPRLAPREVRIVRHLPRTPAGQVLHAALRDRVEG